MQDVCNGERAAGSRLLGCTNSPETRLVRVSSFFFILAIGSGAHLWLASFSPSALLSGCVVLFVILFFLPLTPTKPTPVPPYLHMYGTYTKLGYLPLRLSPESSGQQEEEGSPLLAFYAAQLLMTSVMAADGCTQPLALGLGAPRSFNKSKSAQCHYINILGQLP